MRFEIEPYEGAIPIRFGISETDVLQLLGDPDDISTNSRGSRHYFYGPMTIGFAKEDGKVVHVAFSPGVDVEFRGLNVFEPGAFEKICELDGNPMEYVGSITLLEFGIDFFGFHGDEEGEVVSVFTREELANFNRRHMKPFRIV